MKLQNICIFGTGGVGGFIGGKIANAINQNKLPYKIHFIARGEHLEKIQNNGLILKTSDKTLKCYPETATDKIETLPKNIDLFIIAVKGYDLEDACKKIKSHISEKTIILPLLNGVDIYERIRKTIKTGIVLPACIYVGTHIENPGTIVQKGGEGKILFGKDPSHIDFTSKEITDLFDKSNIPYKWNDDPYPDIWSKYIFIASFGLVTASTNKTIGQIMESPDQIKILEQISKEMANIAKKKNINLPDDIVSKSIEKGNLFPKETKTSYQRDVETVGKKDEGDLFGGAIIRMGKEMGVPTPVTESIYEKLRH